MTLKILSNTYVANGYVLKTSYSGIVVESTATIGIPGLLLTAEGAVYNYGEIFGRTKGGIHIPVTSGVELRAGGVVDNGASGAISGYLGVYLDVGGTVSNNGAINGMQIGVAAAGYADVDNEHTGNITGATFAGVSLLAGGTVNNAGYIEGPTAGVVLSGVGTVINDVGGYSQTVGNGVELNKAGGVDNAGTIIAGYTAAGEVGIELAAGGSVSNGYLGGGGAGFIYAYGGVAIAGAAGTVTNYGKIYGAHSAGVQMTSGGAVRNGATSGSVAVIGGRGAGFIISGAAGTVFNYGIIDGQGADGVDLDVGGAVTNGSGADLAAVITGNDTALAIEGGQAVVTNYGTIGGEQMGVYADAGAITITNFGTIEGVSGPAVSMTSAADVLVVEAKSVFEGAVLGGGGTLVLATGVGTLAGLLSGAAVTVSGSMATTSFQNFGTVTIGARAAFSDAGAVAIAAGFAVVDGGTLTLGAKKTKVTNAGLIETTGAGVLTIEGALVNTGTLAVDRGTLKVDGAVTGKGGGATIDGGVLDLASTFSQDVTFTGKTGTLQLSSSQGYKAAITGFSRNGGTSLDLVDIDFVSSGEATFSGTKKSGVLTITDGTHTAEITLKGNFTKTTFTASSDGHGGTIVVDKAGGGGAASVTLSPQRLIAAMASLGSQTGAGWASQADTAVRPLLATRLLAPRVAPG
jgi:hypothetical protein